MISSKVTPVEECPMCGENNIRLTNILNNNLSKAGQLHVSCACQPASFPQSQHYGGLETPESAYSLRPHSHS